MGYSVGALRALDNLIGTRIPLGGFILDIGSQDISGATVDDLRPLVTKVHGERANSLLAERFRAGQIWKVADLFKGSSIHHKSVDLYPGESIIEADLNTFVVPIEYRGTFDLVANLGSTEHIFDQVNAFRCMHDFAKVGGLLWHSVPIIGYYNHGLFNYHPLFFVFLAGANGYEIEYASLSVPHLEYTIPASPVLHGTEAWSGIRQFGGIGGFVLKKTLDQPFQLFTDHDRTVVNAESDAERQLSDAWLEMLQNRYDLRVRD
jgi:hypothetical protein